jgi:hypothetical protein
MEGLTDEEREALKAANAAEAIRKRLVVFCVHIVIVLAL